MKLSLWKRVAGTVVAVLITGCATVGPIDRPVVSVSRDVALAEIPGLSANVFAAQGTLVQIEDPVLYVPDQTIPFEGFYFFSVRILNTNAFEGEQTEFDVVGGPERLNSFISQVKFVTEEHGGWGETTLAGLRGARDDLKGMVDGIAQLLFHPIESAKLMKDGGGAAVDYMKKMYHGEVSLRADAGRFLEAYAENVYESEAQRFGFSFQDIQIPEAKDAVVRMGRAKMTGMAATELAVLMVAWLKISKVTEAAKIGQAAGKASVASQGASGGGTLTKAGAWGPAFSYAVHAEQGAARAAAAASIAARAKPLEMLRPLLQPSKIATLRAEIAYRQAATNGSALVSQLHADWTNAAANAEAAFNALSRATSKRNLILFRWNTQGERSASAKAGSFFGGKASRGSSQTGYGLVAGFRTSTLFVGADIIMQLSHDVSAVRNTVKKGMVVPTFSIAASNLLYFAQSDLASEIQAKLQGSYSQFSNLGATLKGLDEIELAYVAQRLESLSNTGVVQGPSQITATRFSTYRTLEKLVDEVKASEGWTTFYAILTRAEEVVRVYAPPPAATRSK